MGTEPPLFGSLRFAVSSTELLYERSLQRFRKEAEAEEAEIAKRMEEMRKAEEKVKVVEEEIPTPTMERRISIPKILINSKDQEDEAAIRKKRSFKRRLSGGVTGAQQQYIWAKRRQSLKNQTELEEISEGFKDKKRGITPQSSTENENIEEEEEMVEEEEEQGGIREMHLSGRSDSQEREEEEFAKVRQRLEEKKQEMQNGGKSKHLAEEEKWDSEEELSEEDISDDERSKHDTMPPLIQAIEEETYHPRMSNVIMTPSSPTTPKSEEPFEILTKPAPLPDPNFAPKPILKKSDNNNKSTPAKPERKSLGNDVPPVPPASPKRSPSKSPSKSPIKDVSPQEAAVSTTTESQLISAAKAAKDKRNLLRRDSEEEAIAVADYYGSIVQEYGSLKRSQPRMYLNRDDLSRAAQEQEEEKEKPKSPIKSPEKSPAKSLEKTPDKSPEKSPEKSSEELYVDEEYKAYEELLKRYQEAPVIHVEKPKLELQKRPEPKTPEQRRQELISAYDATKFQRTDYSRAPESPKELRFVHQESRESKDTPGIPSRFALSFDPQLHRHEQSRQQAPSPENYQRPDDLQAYVDVTTRFQQIEARYHQLHSRPQETSARHHEPTTSKRHPSPSPYKRTPTAIEPPHVLAYDESAMARAPPPPSPTHRRSMEITPIEQRTGRKTSRNRSNSRTRKSSRQRSSTPSDILEKISRSPSPRLSSREDEDKLVVAEQNVRSSMEYATDVTMVLLAFYLYIFKDPLFAIPCLIITVYRQLKDSVEKWTPSWMKKKPS